MSPRKAASLASEYRVWSWWQGAWWMVDHSTDRDRMLHSAEQRQRFVRTPRSGRPAINPTGQFIITVPGQTPGELR